MATCLTLLLAGCGSSGSGAADKPYGDKDATAELRILMDDALQTRQAEFDLVMEWVDAMDHFHNLTFAPDTYVQITDLDDTESLTNAIDEAVAAGQPFDVVLAQEPTTQALQDAGYVVQGYDALNMAKLYFYGANQPCIVRKSGGDVQMPDTRLVGGVEDANAKEFKVAYLAGSGLRIAVAPEDTQQGRVANQILASLGLYSEEGGTGGEYDASIAGQITVAESVERCKALVADGECDIGFLYTFDFESGDGTYSPDVVELLYDIPPRFWGENSGGVYTAGLLESSPNKDAARWYMNVLYQ